MGKRVVLLVVGAGLIAVGMVVSLAAFFVSPSAYFFGGPLAVMLLVIGGRIMGKTIRLWIQRAPGG